MGQRFSYAFLGLALCTLGTFALGEFLPNQRQFWAALGAVIEGVVFVMLGYVLYCVKWGGRVPAWGFALLPLAGALFAWRLAYRRIAGLEV